MPIARSYVCEKCGRELASQDDYKQHKIDHQLGKVDGGIDPVTGEPRMNEEQITVTKAEPVKEEDVTVKLGAVVKPWDTAKPERKPIKLIYRFEGNCETCGRPVDTLEMDVGNDFYCVAFCTACHEKKTQRKVAKL